MADPTDQANSRRAAQPAGDDKEAALRRARAKIAELQRLQSAPDALQGRILSELGVDDAGADANPPKAGSH